MEPNSGVVATLRSSATLLDVLVDAPRGNVLSGAVMAELDRVLAAHAEDRHLKLVALRGAGAHFSFGASVEEHRKDEAAKMLAGFHALIRRVGKYPLPIAAFVDGRCLGGAFELVLACHLVIATPRASFACPEIKLGVVPPVLAALGSARLGSAVAERMLLTGGALDARTANALGFVAELAPGGEDLGAFALAWHERTMAPLSAFVIRQGVTAARRGSGLAALLDQGIAAAEEQYLSALLPSHDGNEGIEAFLAKRPPEWRDA